MASLKHTLLAIALAAAKADRAFPSDEVRDLHDQLRRGLYRHRACLEKLGITAADLADIDNHGAVTLGGTPKGPPPEEP